MICENHAGQPMLSQKRYEGFGIYPVCRDMISSGASINELSGI